MDNQPSPDNSNNAYNDDHQENSRPADYQANYSNDSNASPYSKKSSKLWAILFVLFMAVLGACIWYSIVTRS